MEIWNTGPFDNHEAAELLNDVRSGDLYLEELLPDSGTRFIDADQGALIVALAHLAAGGNTRVILYVDAGNTPAVALYERSGFRIVHTDTLYRPAAEE